MHVSWSFLDKRQATMDAIGAYNAMNFIVKHTAEDVQKVRERMGGATSPTLDGMPHTHDPRSRENSLLSGIAEIDVLQERYRQAVEYMDWFKPAWDQLTDDERYVLDVFYMNANECTDGIALIMDHFHIVRGSAYNRKNAALKRLVCLLYGSV